MEVIKYLIEQGAEIEAKDINGWTTLIHSSAAGNSEYWTFKKKYTNNNEPELNWNTGHLPVTKYLVENGANIEAKTKQGATALMISSLEGDWKYFNLEKKNTNKLINRL